MNRIEALHTLGLDEDASVDEIKTAYKETAQILHPDRFATNRKLQDRATEQFKHLQEAYEYLTSGRGSKGGSARRQTSAASSRGYASTGSYVEARLAGLAAARAQIVAQRDVVRDQRRNALIMLGVGLAAAIFLRRILWIAGVAGAVIVLGIINLIGAQGNLRVLDDNIRQIDLQRKQLEEQLEEDTE